MFPWRSKPLLRITVFAVLAFSACSLVDLRPIGVSTVPEPPADLLPDTESPLAVLFDTEMEKAQMEKVFQVYSQTGAVEGSFTWEGNNLYFYPSVPWKPGIRYALRLSGTVYAKDGREIPLSRDIPFYAVSRSPLPYVKSFSPPDSASISLHGLAGYAGSLRSAGETVPVILELVFSLPMDRRSTEDAITADIPGEKVFEWFDGDRVLRLGSGKPLNPWAVYRWSISGKALGKDGAPLAKEVSGRFVTDLEKDIIRVSGILPLIPPGPSPAQGSALWGSWAPAGTGLTRGLGQGQGIGVQFSKAPEHGSLRRAFSSVPALPGRVEILSPLSAVFIPSKDPEPETVYSLRISGALMDLEGLKMGDDYVCSFASDIPYIRVLSINFGQGGEKTTPVSGDAFSAPVSPRGTVSCIVRFSLPFNTADPGIQEECVFKISLHLFFPGTLPVVSLRTAKWLSSDQLFLEWDGPEKGRPGEAHYYKLLIPGGPGGVRNGSGSYFKEDFCLYLEAENG